MGQGSTGIISCSIQLPQSQSCNSLCAYDWRHLPSSKDILLNMLSKMPLYGLASVKH